jgi:hypothetical protein
MVLVGWALCGGYTDQRHHIGGCVGKRMKSVGEDRDGAGKVPKRDLRERDNQIESEDAPEDAGDGTVAISQFEIRNAEFTSRAILRTQNEVKAIDLHPDYANPSSLHFAS